MKEKYRENLSSQKASSALSALGLLVRICWLKQCEDVQPNSRLPSLLSTPPPEKARFVFKMTADYRKNAQKLQ